MMISIVIPVYNVEAYLRRCLDSAVHQTDSDCEILLIDDGSTDTSGAICDEYAEQSSRIKVFHKVNGGLSSARNYGIERAVGEYVIFLDSDDYIELDLCRTLQKAVDEVSRADALVYGGMEESEGMITPLRSVEPEELEIHSGKEFLLKCFKQRNMNVQAWLYAYRREFLMERCLRFREGILHEDVEFTPRALLMAEQVVTVPGNYYHYMVRADSISTQKSKEKNIRDLFMTLQEQTELAEQQDTELCRWMKDAVLNSYLNMIQEARMYQVRYRKLIDKKFMLNKAVTRWNRFRVLLCVINVRLYCLVNDVYKRVK
ncbi:MAG: glycosyltransferase [Clostridiales bacterium]|nr:glycosyltransferase [Clostridiales bacterium]